MRIRLELEMKDVMELGKKFRANCVFSFLVACIYTYSAFDYAMTSNQIPYFYVVCALTTPFGTWLGLTYVRLLPSSAKDKVIYYHTFGHPGILRKIRLAIILLAGIALVLLFFDLQRNIQEFSADFSNEKSTILSLVTIIMFTSASTLWLIVDTCVLIWSFKQGGK